MRHTGLAVALAVMAACGGSDVLTGPDPVPGATVHLSGIVVETSAILGDRPVGGVTVEIAGARTTTAADGSYSFDIANVPAGTGMTIMVWRGTTPVAQRQITLAYETRADFTIAALGSSLSGMVYEVTADGRIPLEKVHVENSNTHESMLTDAEGRYRLLSIEGNQVTLYVNKPGYREISQRAVTVQGDQRLDIELVQASGGR